MQRAHLSKNLNQLQVHLSLPSCESAVFHTHVTVCPLDQALAYINFYLFLQLDVGVDPPSFDLGIEASPAGTNEVTPKDKIFAVQRIISPNQQDPSKPQSSRRSCGVAEMSPYDASRHLAQCIILDIVHVIEESIDPTDKVLYGQWITQPYVKLATPATTSPSVDWASDLLPAMPDPDVVGAIIECCNELSETHDRWCIIFHCHI